MLGLLEGVRIIDFTSVVLGPYATQMLGDLGAEVIKVEPLTGDAFRSVRPGHHAEMGAGFLNLNRNKRSIAIDLRQPSGLEIADRLVASADIVIHNMRPDSAKRLGIDFERLKTINPTLAYCYTPGFGSEGRYSSEPAYDDIIQARSGLASLNANVAGEPRFLTTIVADKVGGLHLAVGALSAFLSQQRTGEAVCLEVPMFESMVSFLMVEQLAGRTFDPPLGETGYERLLSPFRKPHKTLDGYVAVLPYTTAHWVKFLRIVGRTDLENDPRVVDPVERSRNIDMLYELIEQSVTSRTTEDWLTIFGENDIPCAPVKDLNGVLDDPHLADVGMFGTVLHPSEGTINTVRSPFRSGAQRADEPAPRLGADCAALLAQAGYSDAEIRRLEDDGVVGLSSIAEAGPA